MTPRILWLHSDKAGCGTYRTYIPGLTLEAEGYDNNYLLHKGMRPGFTDETGNPVLENIDIVVFQRCFGPLAVDWVAECERRGIATVIELDDDLFTVPKHNPAAQFWREPGAQQAVAALLRRVDHVIASTHPLSRSIEERAGVPRDRVTVAHNHLHRMVWPEALLEDRQHPGPEGQIVLGWQGSHTHDGDFLPVIKPLIHVLETYPHVLLRFFGSVPLTLRGHIPEARFQWSHGVPFDIYPAALRYAHFDIGIAPLQDHAFNRAKSHLKWMEYSALKVPCVASDVYPYQQVITPGVTGYCCRTEDQWVTALSRFIEDADHRREVAEAAYRHVWTMWTPEQQIGAWRTAFDKALAHAGQPIRG